MLDKIREKKSSWLSWMFTVIIIVVFVAFFGPGSFRKTRKGCGVQAYAAKVDGTPISIEDFNFAYQSRRREMSARSGGKLDRAMEKALNLKGTVLDELVDLHLLTQTARRMGLIISDDELNRAIMNDPAFQNQGQFDFKLYTRVVRYHFQLSLKKFEERQRARLLAQKVIGILRILVRMSDDEIWEEYVRKNNQVNLQYATFEDAAFMKDVAIGDGEADDLLKTDRAKVEAYYKAHEQEYNTPKKVRARHILIKTGADASAGEVKEAKEKAEKLIAEIKGGAAFDDLARKNSDDPGSKDKGGDLDWFEKGRMVKEFDEVAFTLGKGETTQSPVRTPYGFHVIRVDDVRDAVKVEFKDVERTLARKILADQAAEAKAKDAAGRAVAELKEGKRLTDLFPLFAEHKDEPAEEGKEPAPKAPTQEAPVVVKETGLFPKAGNYVPQLGVVPDIAEDAFGLEVAKPAADKPYRAPGKYYVIFLKERQFPDKTKFEQEKDTFASQVVMSKQGSIITDWIKSLREGAAVVVNHEIVSYEGKPEREHMYDM